MVVLRVGKGLKKVFYVCVDVRVIVNGVNVKKKERELKKKKRKKKNKKKKRKKKKKMLK